MADGMDRAHQLRQGIPDQAYRCERCAGFDETRQCGFFYGRFDPANWRCGTLLAMQEAAYAEGSVATHHGVVTAILANPLMADGYVMLTWQDGQPKRVSSALWFDTLGKAAVLSVGYAERMASTR